MGGTTFETYAKGDSVSAAFEEARRQASFENGHGGYTGTIAEKDGYVVIQSTPVSKARAYQMAQDLIEKDDPRLSDTWGPAGAIAVGASESRTVEVDLQAPFLIDYQSAERWKPLATAKVRLRAGEEVTALIVKGLDRHAIKFKISQRATEGKAVTRYVFGHQAWGAGAPSQAEARAAAARALGDLGNGFTFLSGNTTLEITAVTRRENGGPLVIAERTITQSKATIEVTISTIPRASQPIGWLLFGWASC